MHQDGAGGDSPAVSKTAVSSAPPPPTSIQQTGTALHETYGNFDFAAADWNRDGVVDLIAIKKSHTGTESTEVHVLSGAGKFQAFLLQTGTTIPETYENFDFAVADWSRDGRVDLIAIKKNHTGTQRTEVLVRGL